MPKPPQSHRARRIQTSSFEVPETLKLLNRLRVILRLFQCGKMLFNRVPDELLDRTVACLASGFDGSLLKLFIELDLHWKRPIITAERFLSEGFGTRIPFVANNTPGTSAALMQWSAIHASWLSSISSGGTSPTPVAHEAR